jgi:hypothetical protein
MASVRIEAEGGLFGKIGKIVKSTKNGWYSVLLDDDTVVKVRGRSNLKELDEETSEETSEETDSVCTALYTKASRLTRSQAAAVRRDELVLQIKADKPCKVKKCSLRVVVANKRGELQYQQLCDKCTHTLPHKELEALCNESEHFRRAWEHVKHRDSSRLWGLDQDTPHVVYMAVMPLRPELLTRHTQGDKVLEHRAGDQGYVGLAKHGIAHRWGAYEYNHVRSANESESRKCTLVDATMRLHCASDGVVWLFVVQHNPDLPLRAEERRLIHYFGTHGERGMNATQ